MTPTAQFTIAAIERFALSIDEVAQSVGCARQDVRLAVRSGVLRSVRIGRALVVPVEDIAVWLDSLPDATSFVDEWFAPEVTEPAVSSLVGALDNVSYLKA